MSALARYFKHMGKQVMGYDKVQTPLTIELEKSGIGVHYDDHVKHIPSACNPDNTLVVYTPAVPESNTEYSYFINHGFQVKKRSQVLGLITEDTFCFAVAGTHGKTSTTSILAHLLRETNTPVSVFLGGISEDFNSNFYFGGSQYSVVEADEFDRSFLRLSPNVACITSMDADHLDIYGDTETMHQGYRDFVSRIKPGGTLFVRHGLPIAGITYGFEAQAQFRAVNVRLETTGYVFDIETPTNTYTGVRFPKPGKHNLLNALVAFAMALKSGNNPDDLIAALASFKGVLRRFTYKINNDNLVYIDDYAHHPTEIDAVYDAISEMYPEKENLAIFQPHLYSRTQDFAQDFAKSLSRFDNIILLDIYPAREEPIAGVTASWLLQMIQKEGKKLLSKEQIIDAIKEQKPQVLITMGAGDIGLEADKIKKELMYGI